MDQRLKKSQAKPTSRLKLNKTSEVKSFQNSPLGDNSIKAFIPEQYPTNCSSIHKFESYSNNLSKGAHTGENLHAQKSSLKQKPKRFKKSNLKLNKENKSKQKHNKADHFILEDSSRQMDFTLNMLSHRNKMSNLFSSDNTYESFFNSMMKNPDESNNKTLRNENKPVNEENRHAMNNCSNCFQFKDSRMEKLFNILGLMKERKSFFDHQIVNFNDFLLLGRSDLDEMNLSMIIKNRVLNFIQDYQTYASKFDLKELLYYFTLNKKYIYNQEEFTKATKIHDNRDYIKVVNQENSNLRSDNERVSSNFNSEKHPTNTSMSQIISKKNVENYLSNYSSNKAPLKIIQDKTSEERSEDLDVKDTTVINTNSTRDKDYETLKIKIESHLNDLEDHKAKSVLRQSRINSNFSKVLFSNETSNLLTFYNRTRKVNKPNTLNKFPASSQCRNTHKVAEIQSACNASVDISRYDVAKLYDIWSEKKELKDSLSLCSQGIGNKKELIKILSGIDESV